MRLPNLQQIQVQDAKLGELIAARRQDEAAELVRRYRSAVLSDAGVVEFARSQPAAAHDLFEQALNIDPANRVAFHNLVACLLQQRSLKGENFARIARFIGQHLGRIDWVQEYRRLVCMPTFLNVQLVAGRCNLRCRMCAGAHERGAQSELRWLSAADFRRMVEAAPTINGVTFSSGDSDPLLHPEFAEVVRVASGHRLQCDMFTNGQALTPELSRQIVDAQAIGMINFSVDAATAETYKRIRGGSFDRLLRNVETLMALRDERQLSRPWFSFSFVAMEDNIAELPAFVDLALRFKSGRVFVEHLLGWKDEPNGNYPARDNPRWAEFVVEARRRAAAATLLLVLPEYMRTCGDANGGGCGGVAVPTTKPLTQCSWLNGVWINMDGRMDTCCAINGMADLGNIFDGPLFESEKFQRVKAQLLEGKVFRRCASQLGCVYVQQQLAAGHKLRFITREDLGELFQYGDSLPGEDAPAATPAPEPAALPT